MTALNYSTLFHFTFAVEFKFMSHLNDSTMKRRILFSVMCAVIAASVFVAGLNATGAVNSAIEFLKHSNEYVRWGATIGPFLMGVITGSGDAAAIAFNTAVTPHAAELGYTQVNLGMGAAIAGALGRTASPIAGVAIVCAGLTMVSPVEIIKRTAPGMIFALLFLALFML